MSRAVLLPTPGSNPFLLETWLRNYDSWRIADDDLYVFVSWPVEDDVARVLDHLVEKRGGRCTFNESGERLDHGGALQILISQVRFENETILFMEDDLYVRDRWSLDSICGAVEHGRFAIAGCPRRNGSAELFAAMWNRETAALWPHLLVAQREAVQQVKEMWGARIWEPDEEIVGLNYRALDRIHSDTAVAATLELRQGRRVWELQTDNVERANEDSPWFHVGSLSSGPLMNHPAGATPEEAAAGDQTSWAQRVAWWERTLKVGTLGLDDLWQSHRKALIRLERAVGGKGHVDLWRKRYDALVNWTEAAA